MSADLWTDVIAPEVLRQCDALDGVSSLLDSSVGRRKTNYQKSCSWKTALLAIRECAGTRKSISLSASNRASHRISFRPETLTCRPNQNRSTCLTSPQISALHHIYSDYFEANQTYIFGGLYPGGEDAYFDGLAGDIQFPISLDYFRFFVLKYVGQSS